MRLARKALLLLIMSVTLSGCNNALESDINTANEEVTSEASTEETTYEETTYEETIYMEIEQGKRELDSYFEQACETFKGLKSDEAYIEAVNALQDERIFYAYIAFEDDRFYLNPEEQLPEGYRPTQRPWYVGAIEDGIYTDAYTDAFSQELIYSVAKEIGNEHVGEVVLGMDFILESDPARLRAYDEYLNPSNSISSLEEIEDMLDEPVLFLTEEDQVKWQNIMDKMDEDMVPYSSKDQIEAVLKSLCDEELLAITAYLASPDGKFFISEDLELPDGYDPTARPWYGAAMETEGLYVAEPYVDAITDKMVNSLFMELENAPEAGWVLGIDLME